MFARITAWADNHLVPEWRKGWRFISVQAAGIQAAVLVTWATLPDDLKQALPGWLLPMIAGFVLVVGTIGVFINQKKLKTENADVRPQ